MLLTAWMRAIRELCRARSHARSAEAHNIKSSQWLRLSLALVSYNRLMQELSHSRYPLFLAAPYLPQDCPLSKSARNAMSQNRADECNDDKRGGPNSDEYPPWKVTRHVGSCRSFAKTGPITPLHQSGKRNFAQRLCGQIAQMSLSTFLSFLWVSCPPIDELFPVSSRLITYRQRLPESLWVYSASTAMRLPRRITEPCLACIDHPSGWQSGNGAEGMATIIPLVVSLWCGRLQRLQRVLL